MQEQALKQNYGHAAQPASTGSAWPGLIQQQGAGPHRRAAARRAGHSQTETSWAAPPRWRRCAWWTRAPGLPLDGHRPRALRRPEKYLDRNGQAVIVKKQVILTGENLTDAQPASTARPRSPP